MVSSLLMIREYQNQLQESSILMPKFWLAEGEQNDLFQAAKVIMQMLDDKHLLSEPSFKVPCGSGPAQKPPA